MTVDREQLLDWLNERGKATRSPVIGAVYAGLAERIRRGEFDAEETPHG